MRAALLAACVACWQLAAAAPAEAGQGVSVHPAGESVPENLLRIELRFSPPLRAPPYPDRIRLLDAQGREIPGALLDLGLPSADGRRLSLLMDPGRVKSGVAPNRAFGRVLHAGSTVRLVVDHPALAHPVVKTWAITAFDAKPPEPERWRFDVPRTHSRDPLVLQLGEPISSAADGLIAVRDPEGRRVPGRIGLERGDTVWHFTPSRPWRAGTYAIVAHPELEDPAGNRACAAFEQVRASSVHCDTPATLPFEPDPAVRSAKHGT